MEIDITAFFENADPFEFSHSRANAGPQTWANAKEEAQRSPLLTTPEQLDALRSYVREFGAWSEEEIAAWGPIECNALFIQLISGDMREGNLDREEPDWDAYEADDSLTHNIFKAGNDKIYYSLSP